MLDKAGHSISLCIVIELKTLHMDIPTYLHFKRRFPLVPEVNLCG